MLPYYLLKTEQVCNIKINVRHTEMIIHPGLIMQLNFLLDQFFTKEWSVVCWKEECKQINEWVEVYEMHGWINHMRPHLKEEYDKKTNFDKYFKIADCMYLGLNY